MIKENLKSFTKQFCPFLFEIIGDKEFIWNDISSKFGKKLENANVKILDEGGIIIENSLPVLLGKAEQGDNLSKIFLSFIDSEIKILYNSVPTKLKDKVIGLFRRLFMEFDKAEQVKPNPTYLNGLSEILAINKLIKSGDYELEAIEENLANNKCADFSLLHGVTKVKSFVEIYNIHVESSKVEDFESFKKFMDDRIIQKYSDKTNGLDTETKSHFYLISIIWANDDVNEYINQYSRDFSLERINALKPCSLVQFDKKGIKGFYFGFHSEVDPRM